MARTAVKFGAFVAMCMVFTLYLASTIGNTTVLGLAGRGPSTYSLQAEFDDVSGLLLDDNVKVAGVPIGKVDDIEVVAGRALVTMQIRSSYQLPSDSTASIRWRNLIGQRYVYLVPGDAPTTLEDGAVITDTTNVVDLGELFNRLGPIVATIDEGKVNDFLDTVTTALEGNQEDISAALDDLAFLVRSLGERDDSIARLVTNLEVVSRTVADRDAQIETMLDNLATLSRTFSDNTELLDRAITEMGAFNRDLSSVLTGNRTELDSIIANLDTTLDTVEANLDDLEIVVDNLDENAAATFRTSRYGTFLNYSILCLTAVEPPCPSPIVSGLGGVTSTDTDGAVRVDLSRRTGGAAILSLVGGAT